MKVIAINGSPRKDGNTAIALDLMKQELEAKKIEVEIIQVGNQEIRGCIACNHCNVSKDNLCIFSDDITNETILKMREADGIILGSPTYYAGIAGTMKCFLDRVFYSSSNYFEHKVATAVVSVRRTGGIDVLHQLNNFLDLALTINPPSQYWMVGYGNEKGEILKDDEGIQTIKKNAQAMAWLLESIDSSKNIIESPKYEDKVFTNFIR